MTLKLKKKKNCISSSFISFVEILVSFGASEEGKILKDDKKNLNMWSQT